MPGHFFAIFSSHALGGLFLYTEAHLPRARNGHHHQCSPTSLRLPIRLARCKIFGTKQMVDAIVIAREKETDRVLYRRACKIVKIVCGEPIPIAALRCSLRPYFRFPHIMSFSGPPQMYRDQGRVSRRLPRLCHLVGVGIGDVRVLESGPRRTPDSSRFVGGSGGAEPP